jgi:glycolate oxidase FAD binding subunit
MIITPTSTEQLAEIIREAAQQNQTIAPLGNRTKQNWGNPITPQLEIDTTNLTGIREHSWGDLTATVAAGTPWQTMQDELAKHNQRVALDPLFPTHATIGGILATNDSGLLRLKYGSLRDLVLGMTIVLADGTIARTGGKVVKNVAGYDLPKLLTGSFGTLGIITEATFRLHPIPQYTANFTVRSTEIAPLADLMSAILRESMSLEQMQLRNETLAFALDLQFASLPEVLTEHERRLRTLTPLPVESAANDIWLTREHLFANPAATILKITALPTKLAALTAGFAQLAQQPDHTAHCLADPVGIVTAAVTAPPATLAQIVEDLRARLANTGGAVVVLQRGKLPSETDAWGTPPAALEIMRNIKQEFDPANLLNPGKFIGGM